MPHPSQTQGYVLAVLIVVIWSGFVLVARMGGVSPLTPYDVAAIRLGTAFRIVLPLARRYASRPLFAPRPLALAATGGLGYTLLAFAGFHLAPASHAAVLLSGFQPFAVTLFCWLVLGERPSPRRRVGILLIAVGAALLGARIVRDGAIDWPGDLLFIGASLCLAFYTVLARHWRIGPWQVTVNVGLLAALAYLPVYLLLLPKGLARAGWSDIALQAAYQGVLAAVLQTAIYMRAVQILGPSRMSMLVALVPPLAALGAGFILHEPLTATILASLTLVFLGVVVGNTTPRLIPQEA